MMPKSAMARMTRVAVEAQSCFVQRSSRLISSATFSSPGDDAASPSPPRRARDAAP